MIPAFHNPKCRNGRKSSCSCSDICGAASGTFCNIALLFGSRRLSAKIWLPPSRPTNGEGLLWSVTGFHVWYCDTSARGLDESVLEVGSAFPFSRVWPGPSILLMKKVLGGWSQERNSIQPAVYVQLSSKTVPLYILPVYKYFVFQLLKSIETSRIKLRWMIY